MKPRHFIFTGLSLGTIALLIFLIFQYVFASTINITPSPGLRTICTTKVTLEDQLLSACSENESSRIACANPSILCTYQGGWKMCVENKEDYNAKEEVCGRYTVSIDGQNAPAISAEFSSLQDKRSICSNMHFTSYDPPSTKSTCQAAEAGIYIACAGENDRICKQSDSQGKVQYYGCTQFSDCQDLFGKSYPSYQVEEIANVVWVKHDGFGAPKLDGKCRKTFITDNSLVTKTYTSKQECESAVAPSPSPSPSPTPSPSPGSCSATQYYRNSDHRCYPESNCWDHNHLDYSTSECDEIRRTRPAPSPSPSPSSTTTQCPRKPDPAKGMAEPAAIPEGYELREVPSYYLWGCYSQADKTNNSECTPQATKRTGNATSPCVFGEESIIGPSNGKSYREGNFLKWAPLKKIASATNDAPPPEPVVITRTIEKIVPVEVPSATSVVPPLFVTDDTCKTYKEDIDAKIIAQGDAFLDAADAAFKATTIKNPAFKKVFYERLKESAKSSRKLEKLVKTSGCNVDGVLQLEATVRDFEVENLAKVKQSLVFAVQEKTVQNQYVGITEDSRWIENFIKTIKPNSAQEKIYAEDIKVFRQIQTEFADILDAEKEGKVFSFEVEDIAASMSEVRKNFQTKAAQVTSSSSSKKDDATVKKADKKSIKTSKKSSKKSTKKKSTKKKSTKKKSDQKKKSEKTE